MSRSRIALGSDMPDPLVDHVKSWLESRGYEVRSFGAPLDGKEHPWPIVAREVAESVAGGECNQGVVMCWTGTGVSIAANKVPGIRAALCFDPQTAKEARIWNHANVLALSIRLCSSHLASEILEVFFSTQYEQNQKPMVDLISEIESKYAGR